MGKLLRIVLIVAALAGCAYQQPSPRPWGPFNYQVPIPAEDEPIVTTLQNYCGQVWVQRFEDGTLYVIAHGCTVDIQKVRY